MRATLHSHSIVLLGPQRLQPTLNLAVAAVAEHDPRVASGAPIAAVTAGWEEREGEHQELDDHLAGRVVNLNLYERTEDAYRRDPELLAAMRARHDKLRRLQELYRVRLVHALAAVRALFEFDSAAQRSNLGADPHLLAAEQAEAIEAVRELDARHAVHIREIHLEFVARTRPLEREAIQRHRGELARILADCCALCVAGGHVAILLNRMRLFELGSLIQRQPIFAWSAGTMALAERVVVFHDHPPHGSGDAEVLELGLALFQGVVPLPHASRRLDLEDRLRVSLFARRFAPAACVALDPLTRMDWDGRRWRPQGELKRLSTTGIVERFDG